MPDWIPRCRTRRTGRRCDQAGVYQATVTCSGCSWTTPLAVCPEHAAVVRRTPQPHRCGICRTPMTLLSIKTYPEPDHA